MILVDTSVWIQHLRRGDERLKALLIDGQVICHPFIIGELACGTLRDRGQILKLMQALPEVSVLEHEEVLHLLESRQLYGRGIGWIDAHLLASAVLSGISLWTRDIRLEKLTSYLRISYRP